MALALNEFTFGLVHHARGLVDPKASAKHGTHDADPYPHWIGVLASFLRTDQPTVEAAAARVGSKTRQFTSDSSDDFILYWAGSFATIIAGPSVTARLQTGDYVKAAADRYGDDLVQATRDRELLLRESLTSTPEHSDERPTAPPLPDERERVTAMLQEQNNTEGEPAVHIRPTRSASIERPGARQASSEWRPRDLDRALLEATAQGLVTYFSSPDRIDIPVKEHHFAYVLALHASGATPPNPKVEGALASYVLRPPRFTSPSLLRYNPMLRVIETLPDFTALTRVPPVIRRLSDDQRPNYSLNDSSEFLPGPVTQATIAHFVRGLAIFIQWSLAGRAADVDLTLAHLDGFDLASDYGIDMDMEERAKFAALHAVHVASVRGGDYEYYLTRAALAHMNLGAVDEAADFLDLLLGIQGWGRPAPDQRISPKTLLLRALVAEIRGEEQVERFTGLLSEDWRRTWKWAHTQAQ